MEAIQGLGCSSTAVPGASLFIKGAVVTAECVCAYRTSKSKCGNCFAVTRRAEIDRTLSLCSDSLQGDLIKLL